MDDYTVLKGGKVMLAVRASLVGKRKRKKG